MVSLGWQLRPDVLTRPEPDSEFLAQGLAYMCLGRNWFDPT